MQHDLEAKERRSKWVRSVFPFPVGVLVAGGCVLVGLSAVENAVCQNLQQPKKSPEQIRLGIRKPEAPEMKEVAHVEPETRFFDEKNWLAYDTRNTSGLTDVEGFAGGCFDGRHVYFGAWAYSPDNKTRPFSGRLLRWDSGRGPTDSDGWEAFDASQVGGYQSSGGYGVVCLKDQVLWTPGEEGESPVGRTHGLILAYNKRLPFDKASSYTVVDLSDLHEDAVGFIGACYGNGYAYFPSFYGNCARDSGSCRTVRYHHTGTNTITDLQAWEVSPDLSNLNHQDAHKNYGCTSLGRYVYFGNFDGKMLRHDTSRPLADKDAWELVDKGDLMRGVAALVPTDATSIFPNTITRKISSGSCGSGGKS